MSRVGKSPIKIGSAVKVLLDNKGVVEVSGPKGSLSFAHHGAVSLELAGEELWVRLNDKAEQFKAMWGLTRSIIANMVHGVTVGFEKKLEMVGVGYRAAYNDGALTLSLGYSHDIIYAIPQDIKVEMEKPTVIVLRGSDKQKLGQIAAEIRSLRPPEPYKGKGVRYSDERVIRKAGKKK